MPDDACDRPQPVRVGFMVRSLTLPAWQAAVVRSLLAIDGVEPAALIVDTRPLPDRSPIRRVRRLLSSRHWVWDAYNNGWVSRSSQALSPVDLSPELGGVRRIEVTVERNGFSEYFPAGALAAVVDQDLDVIVRFAFGILRGPVLDAARHGVWSFHHDDEELYRGSPPAFWEIVDGRPVSGAILQQLTDRLDGGIVLDKGWFPTVHHSYVRNTDAVHLGGVDWPARAMRRLIDDGGVTTAHPSRSAAPVLRPPGNAVALRFLARQAGRFVAAQARGVLRADHWQVGVVHAPIERFLDADFDPSVEWLALDRPRVAYAADPFVIDDGGPLVLYERFDSAGRIGEIWQARPDNPGSAGPAGLPVASHASYPYCFTDGGQAFCLPQVAQPGVPLFLRRDGAWHHVTDLLPGEELLDPTLLRHDGRWWLFGTRPGPGSLTKLFLWHAETPTGPWSPHRLNPVKTDVRSARPGGTPFVHGGRLYRPAQDCSDGYGAAVALCEVTRLDTQEFTERVVRVVRPGQGWPNDRGMHTLTSAGPVTLVDARRAVFDRHVAATELGARIRLLRGRVSRR
jgi:hypothetical protein